VFRDSRHLTGAFVRRQAGALRGHLQRAGVPGIAGG